MIETGFPYWKRPLLFGDGHGRSHQLHMLAVGPDEDHLTDTGIIYRVVFNSKPAKSEAVEDQPQGPADLEGEAEFTYEYQGKSYGTDHEALVAWDAAGRPEWNQPNDPCWVTKMAFGGGEDGIENR